LSEPMGDELGGEAGKPDTLDLNDSMSVTKESPNLVPIPPEDRKKVELFVKLRKSGVEAKVAARAAQLSGRKYTQYGSLIKALLQEERKPETMETGNPEGGEGREKTQVETYGDEETQVGKELAELDKKQSAVKRAISRYAPKLEVFGPIGRAWMEGAMYARVKEGEVESRKSQESQPSQGE